MRTKPVFSDNVQNSPMFRLCLEAAVPMWIEEMMGWELASLALYCRRGLGEGITLGGMFLVLPRKGATAQAFNDVAKALAAVALLRGRVEFEGMVFEADHPEYIDSPERLAQRNARIDEHKDWTERMRRDVDECPR